MKVLVLFITLLCGGVTSALAEVRNALVIGNGSYKQIGSLENPVNDAKLMGDTLRKLGFEVIQLIDASQSDIKRAVRNFGYRLNDAGREGIGLFYYAGHGVQVRGANYIIPVDAIINLEGDVDIEAINTNSILSMMEFSNARLNFVILDACRNNPYAQGFRSGTRGLAKMNAPTGSLIAYATSPGDVAVDGSGKNSPYTRALAKAMSESKVPIEKMFRNVRNDVREQTSNRQTPWESSSLVGGDFYFNTVVEVETIDDGQKITITNTKTPGQNSGQTDGTGATTTSIQPIVIENDSKTQLLFWDTVKDSNNPVMFQAYMNKYPEGIFVELARLKIATLTPEQPSYHPANKASSANQSVELASVPTTPIGSLLDECSAHYNSKRLTTGAGGNALDCYTRVLDLRPGQPEALEGLANIEHTYARWASLEIDQNNIAKAERNIHKLRTINENYPDLVVLDNRLNALVLKQQQNQSQQIANTESQSVVIASGQTTRDATKSSPKKSLSHSQQSNGIGGKWHGTIVMETGVLAEYKYGGLIDQDVFIQFNEGNESKVTGKIKVSRGKGGYFDCTNTRIKMSRKDSNHVRISLTGFTCKGKGILRYSDGVISGQIKLSSENSVGATTNIMLMRAN